MDEATAGAFLDDRSLDELGWGLYYVWMRDTAWRTQSKFCIAERYFAKIAKWREAEQNRRGRAFSHDRGRDLRCGYSMSA